MHDLSSEVRIYSLPVQHRGYNRSMTATKSAPTPVSAYREQLDQLVSTQRELEVAQAHLSALADQRATQVAALRLGGVPLWVIAHHLGISSSAVGHLTRRVREATR